MTFNLAARPRGSSLGSPPQLALTKRSGRHGSRRARSAAGGQLLNTRTETTLLHTAFEAKPDSGHLTFLGTDAGWAQRAVGRRPRVGPRPPSPLPAQSSCVLTLRRPALAGSAAGPVPPAGTSVSSSPLPGKGSRRNPHLPAAAACPGSAGGPPSCGVGTPTSPRVPGPTNGRSRAGPALLLLRAVHGLPRRPHVY